MDSYGGPYEKLRMGGRYVSGAAQTASFVLKRGSGKGLQARYSARRAFIAVRWERTRSGGKFERVFEVLGPSGILSEENSVVY